MLTAAAVHVNTDTSLSGLVEAFGIGVDAIMRYGLAQPGNRTMVTLSVIFILSSWICIVLCMLA
jgi:hypothetical protein